MRRAGAAYLPGRASSTRAARHLASSWRSSPRGWLRGASCRPSGLLLQALAHEGLMSRPTGLARGLPLGIAGPHPVLLRLLGGRRLPLGRRLGRGGRTGCRPGRTSRTGRTSRAGRTSRPGRTGCAGRAGRAGCGRAGWGCRRSLPTLPGLRRALSCRSRYSRSGRSRRRGRGGRRALGENVMGLGGQDESRGERKSHKGLTHVNIHCRRRGGQGRSMRLGTRQLRNEARGRRKTQARRAAVAAAGASA